MGQPAANALHRSNDSGKNLSGTPELSSRLDDIANAGNTHRLARRNRVESCLVNSPILQHEPHEIFLVHFQYPGLVAIGVAQVDLADGKSCHFETHKVRYGLFQKFTIISSQNPSFSNRRAMRSSTRSSAFSLANFMSALLSTRSAFCIPALVGMIVRS